MINTSSVNFTLGIALLLTFSISIVKGGAAQWASLLWVTACCLTLSLLIVSDGIKSTSRNISISTFYKTPLVFIIAFQVWTLIQCLTLITLDLPASLEHSLIGIGMVCILAIWYKALNQSFALKNFYKTLISFTIFQSVYGLAIMLSGANLILWMPKLHYLDRPTGFFVNANHFAAYLVLAIILMLSRRVLVVNSHQANSRYTNQFSVLKAIDQIYNPANLAIALLFITLVLTKSVGALTALGTMLVLMATHLAIRHKQFNKLLLIGLLILFIVGLLFLGLDYSIVEQELNGLSHTWWRRLALTQAASSMLNDHWLFGIGGGAFYSQFSPYRSLEIGNSYYNFAHNDLLQFWIEYGLIGITLLVIFVVSVLRDNLKVIASSRSTMRQTFAYTSIYGTIAVGVHSMVDFPLHIPGFSVLFITIISINSLYSAQQNLRSSAIRND